MLVPDVLELTGRIDEGVLDSHLLRGNRLGDPHGGTHLGLHTTPGYDGGTDRYPVVYLLLGYGGTLPLWAQPVPYRRPCPGADRPPVRPRRRPADIVVYVTR